MVNSFQPEEQGRAVPLQKGLTSPHARTRTHTQRAALQTFWRAPPNSLRSVLRNVMCATVCAASRRTRSAAKQVKAARSVHGKFRGGARVCFHFVCLSLFVVGLLFIFTQAFLAADRLQLSVTSHSHLASAVHRRTEAAHTPPETLLHRRPGVPSFSQLVRYNK